MANIKIWASDYWRDGTLTESCEHENFTAENTQHRDFNKPWRSNYGAGSGWGKFLIGSFNNKIDFEETASAELTATLTGGSYTADGLCTEIKTQMDSAGASTYTVTYSDTTNKFTITSNGAGGGGILNLLWGSGTNAANSPYDDLGWPGEDQSLALTYTSHDMRIHNREYITADLGSAKDIYAVVIRGHNLQAGATIKVEFSTDNFSSTADSDTFSVQDDILVIEYDSAETYRYVRLWIEDVDNPDGYVELGTVYVGGHLQPTNNFRRGRSVGYNDGSRPIESEDGQRTSVQLSHFKTYAYSFPVTTSAQAALFDAVFDEVGLSKGLFVCEDPDSPLTTTYYGQILTWRVVSADYTSDYHEYAIEIEELR